MNRHRNADSAEEAIVYNGRSTGSNNKNAVVEGRTGMEFSGESSASQYLLLEQLLAQAHGGKSSVKPGWSRTEQHSYRKWDPSASPSNQSPSQTNVSAMHPKLSCSKIEVLNGKIPRPATPRVKRVMSLPSATTTAGKCNLQWKVVNKDKESGNKQNQDMYAVTERPQCAENKSAAQDVVAIFISEPFPCNHGRPQSISIGETETACISLVNNGTGPVKLLTVRVVYSKPLMSFSLSEAPSPLNSRRKDSRRSSLVGPCLLEPGASISLCLSCHASQLGWHTARILFDFGDQKIVRDVSLLGEDEVAKALVPDKPYSRPRRSNMRATRIVPGVAPPGPNFMKRLKPYWIPKELRRLLSNKELPPVLLGGLSAKNYVEYFSVLQHAEEYQMEIDIQAYNMQNVHMKQVGQFLALKVSGLSERRPSVIYRDSIYARVSGTTDKEYQGYVYNVRNDEVYLKFNASFHRNFVANSRYDIRFSFNRINIRRAHQAISYARRMCKAICFPNPPVAVQPKKLNPINRRLNAEQLNAVNEIVMKKGAPPYIIYGPPGTGKTVTIVEAVLQVRRSNGNAVVLACAPSNSASDLLLERLIGSVEKRHLLRLNAVTRPYGDVPAEVLPFCYMQDSCFCCPDPKALCSYKVIICTYLSAAMLNAQGIPAGHFTHIFLDEAGQGTEPESMVPIANLANGGTVVVLAGDHQQLGPIIRSPIAQEYGLGRSFMERLMSLPPYSGTPSYRKELVTKLLRNYRSHPSIVELPSRLFYSGELIPCAEAELVSSLCNWDYLPTKGFPLLFIGLEGRDEREGSDPSWFNAQEASKVLEIVRNLREYKRSRVSYKDIGIITPYRQQVRKIKKALSLAKIEDVKVGSVEQFQGQERRVIIISTVRSSEEMVDFDKQHNLGFLTNPKRFNVAVTRAKALLVVVGNPHVLRQDPCWRELLALCLSHNSYKGCQLPSVEDDNAEPSDSTAGKNAKLDVAVEDPEWPDGTC